MEEKRDAAWLNTANPEIFIENAAKFADLMMMYRSTIREVKTKLEVLDDEFSSNISEIPSLLLRRESRTASAGFMRFPDSAPCRLSQSSV